jgi:hypothetical protein
LPVVPNLLDQHFDAVEPGKVWGTDITYIPTDEGWLYLAGVKDFASKGIVGMAMGERMTKELTSEALQKLYGSGNRFLERPPFGPRKPIVLSRIPAPDEGCLVGGINVMEAKLLRQCSD